MSEPNGRRGEWTYNPSRGFPRVVPILFYEDVEVAISWLSRVFGFNELLRVVCEGGWIAHADLELENGVIMLDAARGDYAPRKDYRKPILDGHVCSYTFVCVEDVDKHFERARAEGATIVYPPEDKEWGLRQYTAKDYEGHTWEFSQHIGDPPPEEWEATTAHATGEFRP
ncbi:VOC family protein [Bailinhaonella thermotolerans]|uniref:Glyoxalase/bleomycin resistance/extradiol dioxygenase family protein n=1 Tax=Bailinhaonella thermotolerans TaxID=1070861 RepID=A0A3A4AF05_9ACTN|nr:VOC family protein [Bailinhaonella thermotolerans]RJL27235.1 glyoxalase/bleomycin resistance/extradiol dioxygenase family protein [Bailinhaonella thermotolerans]